jgi:transposase InsO family protein
LDKPDPNACVRAEIHVICQEHHGRYGYRRVTAELHKRGFQTNHKLVMKIMKQEHLTCRVRMKKYRSYKGEIGKIAPNLINRDFHATRPNQKWTTDITEFNLFGQKLYLSPILDMFNGEIISYTIYNRPVLKQVTHMLELAFEKIPENTGLILHSDQGWHYQHKAFQKMLLQKGLRQSMSRKGNCLDNSVMENFFGLLKSELLYLQEFESIEDFKKKLIDYIYYYNHLRIKCKLKGMSPIEYRTHSQVAA